MCLAIPFGRRDRSGGSRLGRFLRERPARATRLAGLTVLTLGAILAIGLPASHWAWAALALTQGLSALILAQALERLPERCRVSSPDYPRHVLLGAALVAGAVASAAGAGGLALGGHPGAGIAATGVGLAGYLLAWRLASGPLRWALDWCRGPADGSLRRLPLGLGLGQAAPPVLAAGAWLGMPALSLVGTALAVGALVLLALCGCLRDGLPAPGRSRAAA